MIARHFNKNNLHHAYLVEGVREKILPEIEIFVQSLGAEISGNPDFYHISTDTFSIEDARNLKSLGGNKSFSPDAKKIFVISANSFLLEAQNTLLKMFEEPIENTLFFLIVPDSNTLLKTLVSRFYLIKEDKDMKGELEEAENFIASPLKRRIDFLKEFLVEVEEEEETISQDSTRARALKFLNAVEYVFHKKLKNSSGFTLPGLPGGTYATQNSLISCFQQIFKVREFLRMPGSSTKSLMESVALTIPVLQ